MRRSADRLLQLCHNARKEAILVAPFIKEPALSRVVDALGQSVRLTCVTRWRPEEIAAGVSDLEIVDVISERQHARVLLHPWLHAKYFRGDNHALVGSANVTSRALGWIEPANLELLVDANIADPEVSAFESDLFGAAVEVDDDLVHAVREAVQSLLETGYEPMLKSEDVPAGDSKETARWVPLCPAPDRLYNAYADVDTWKLVTAAAEDARRDLAVLGISPGLARPAFERCVAATLDQFSLIHEIDRKATEGVPDDTAIRLVAEKGALVHEPHVHWRVLKRWLTYFFPGRYRTRPSAEELIRGRRVS